MTDSKDRPLALVILDGWGISNRTEGNAIAMAHTPYYDEIRAKYPGTTLAAAGEKVGLSTGAAGNAEVGHLNIGAGRVVETDVARIEKAIRSGEFFTNPVLQPTFAHAAASGRPLHLIGMLSDGDVHSSQETLFALLRMAKKEGVQDVFVHGVLDGRDVPTRTADVYVEALEIKLADIGIGSIATLCGRYFAMDSSESWERTARAYTMLVHGEGERSADPATAIRNSFLRGISDEFIAPIVIERENGVPMATIGEGDVVVFFNHRSDTMRQLARSLAVPDPLSSAKPKVEAICLTEYDRSYNLPVAFKPEASANMLVQIFENRRIPNFRIAESDRFAHVTSFFNGGAEGPGTYELHHHIPSSPSTNRTNEPELKSFKVTDRLLRGIENEPAGVFVVNLAAPDIIAETGNFEKTIEAVQYVDTCLGGVLEKIREVNGIAVITSSHGHCEDMVNGASGEPNRFPSANHVPFHIIDENSRDHQLRSGGSLQDVAPTILGLLGIEQPAEMTGRDLRS